MTNHTDTFEVYVYKRIPYLTRILGIITILLFLFVTFGLAPLMPSKHHPDEMRILWFIVLYPDKLKAALFLGVPTLLLFGFLYYKVRLKRKAILSFEPDRIELRGKGWSKIFPSNKIRYFDCYDPYSRDDDAIEKFALHLRTWNGKVTIMNLKDYSQATRLVDILTVYEDVKLEVHAETLGQDQVSDEI